MSDNKLQKNVPGAIKEKGQYLLAFGIIASMLVVANIPIFVVFFFGVFAYLLLKMFSTASRNEVREIFEFYLSANEMLREDERKWYGFEINDTISRGESIVRNMSAVPPLVYFALGALYNKVGDHKAAVNNLANVVENPSADESAYAFPTPELRNYVKILRKIEREPADAPLTSAAIRALERARRLRGKALLEESRTKFATEIPIQKLEAADERNIAEIDVERLVNEAEEEVRVLFEKNGRDRVSITENEPVVKRNGNARTNKKSDDDPFADRKPISEVLHDIYDKNVQ